MLNHVALQGRLTRDPEVRATASGTPVASFTLAVERDFKKDGKAETDFINCVAWGRTAEFLKLYFAKGRSMIVTGRLQTRSYEKDGSKRIVTEVNVDTVYFGDSKRTEGPASPDEVFTEPETGDEALPF